MNKKCILSYITSILALVAFISCASPAGGGSEGSETGLAVRMPGRALTSYDKTTVSIFTVTIKSSSYKETKSAGSGETITFSQIPVGTYEVNAIAKDASGTTIAKTKEPVTVVVEQDKVSETTVNLSLLKYALVHFDLNLGIAADGTSNIPDQKITEGEYATAPANPTKTGYVFGGWKLPPPPGAMSTATPINLATYPINDEITFQAIWNQTYSVTFDMNGGNGSNTTIEVPIGGSVQTAQIPTDPTRTGYIFSGWGDTSNATSQTTFNAINAPKTYYAIWEPIHYNLRFNFAIPGSTPAVLQCTYGETATVPDSTTYVPTRSGYTFKGWSTTSGATTATYPYTNSAISITDNLSTGVSGQYIELYAVWDNYQFTVFAYELESALGALDVGQSSQTDTAQQKAGTSILSVTLKARESNTYEMFDSSNTSLGTDSILLLGISDRINFSFSANGKYYQCSSDSNLNFLGNYQVTYASPTLDNLMSAFGTP